MDYYKIKILFDKIFLIINDILRMINTNLILFTEGIQIDDMELVWPSESRLFKYLPTYMVGRKFLSYKLGIELITQN